jgi:hypothetical protein
METDTRKKKYIKDDSDFFFDPNNEENHGKQYTINKVLYTLYNKGGHSYKFVKFNINPKKMGRPRKVYTDEELAAIEEKKKNKKPVGRPKKQAPAIEVAPGGAGV